MSTIHGSPFANGIIAFGKGQSIHSSPYPKGSKESVKWVNGWQACQASTQKAADKAAREAIDRKPLPDWVTAQEATK